MTKSADPATLEDVARRAGVNKVTASIALSGGRGNTRVSEATRQRIRQAADELQYQPNALARSLRRRQTHVFGFYRGGFIDTRNPFLSEVVSGMQLGCEENGRDFLIHGSFRGDSVDDIVAELLNGKVDGLVLHLGADHPLLPRLAASPLPVVMIADPVPGFAAVSVDDAAGARLLAGHLADRGHRRLLYAMSPHPLTSVLRRRAAFHAAAAERGAQVSDVVVPYGAPGLETLERAVLERAPADRPTAVACWNDETAYPLVERLRSRGVRVPGEVAVTGFDGWTTAIPPAYRLTTVHAPWAQVARAAVGLLAGGDGKLEPEEHVFPVELVVGDTT